MATHVRTKSRSANHGDHLTAWHRRRRGGSIPIIGALALGLLFVSESAFAQAPGPGTCTAVKRASPRGPHCVLTQDHCTKGNKAHMTLTAAGCNCVCAP